MDQSQQTAWFSKDQEPVAVLPLETVGLPELLPILKRLEQIDRSWFIIWDPPKLSRRIPKAVRFGLKWALIIGPQELMDQKASVKHLATGQMYTWDWTKQSWPNEP